MGLVAILVFAGACGPSASPSEPPEIDLFEWGIELPDDPIDVDGGAWMVHNNGTLRHELVIVRTDTPGSDLPIVLDRVDLGSIDGEVVIEYEDLAPTSTTPVDVATPPGNYVLLCNISGHYQAGMWTEVRVSK